jgi:hypothetical protein
VTLTHIASFNISTSGIANGTGGGGVYSFVVLALINSVFLLLEICFKKTGPSQHERFRHPNIRNAKRIAEKENDIERKRLAREN